MKYHGIIFDFNGVLLWDIPWHRAAWGRLSKELGVQPFTEGEWQVKEGRSTKDLLPELEGRELPKEEIEKEEKRKDELYRDIAEHEIDDAGLSPGAAALLTQLAEKSIPRAIATSANPHDMQFFIDHLNLLQWFDRDHIVVNDGTFPGKPAPDIYRIAAERIGIPIAECIVIEDSLSGITAASRAGAGKVIGLGPEDRHEEMRRAGANTSIESLQEMRLEELD